MSRGVYSVTVPDDISRRSIIRVGSVAAPLAVSGCLGELVMNEYGEGGGSADGSDGNETESRPQQTTDTETSGGSDEDEATEQDDAADDPDVGDDEGSEEEVGAEVDADATSNFVVKEATTWVDVQITEQGEADYFEIEITGDAKARGRLYRQGDRFRLTPYDVETVRNAEDLTTWRSESFNGAQLGDLITVTVRASVDGVSTVVHERTDYLGPSQVDADLNYLFDETNNRIRVILSDSGNADHVRVRFEGGSGGGTMAEGILEDPGDELVLATDDLADRPNERWGSKVGGRFVSASSYGQAEFLDVDSYPDEDDQITINGTAVIEKERARTKLQTEVAYVTGDLTELSEVEP